MSPQVSIDLSEDSPALFLGDTAIYRPQPKQLEFHTSPAKYTCVGGSRGGGKTFAAIWEAVITCLTIPGCNVLFLRRTLPELKRTVISEFHKLPPAIYSEDPKAFNKSSNVVQFDNGSKLWFGSCPTEDSVRRFLGAEFVLILIEELSEFTYFMFDFLKGANRCPIKVDIAGNPVYPSMKFTTNPGGVGHAWVRNVFLDKKPAPGQEASTYNPDEFLFIKANVWDNHVYANDRNYIATLESLAPALRAAYLHGEWNVFEGQYFACFDAARTVIPADEAIGLMASQPWQPRWAATDWGFEHSCVTFWATSLDLYRPDGTKQPHTLIYREYETKRTGEAALGQEIVRLNNSENLEKLYLSPETFGDSSNRNTRSKLIGDVLVANGLPRPTRADNDRVGGWSLCREMLGGTDDRSRLLISSDCPGLIEAIPLALTDSPKKIEDVKKTSADSDDYLDAWRYLLKSHLSPREAPAEVRLQQTLAPLSHDPSAMHMAHLQFQAKEKQTQKAFFIRGRRR